MLDNIVDIIEESAPAIVGAVIVIALFVLMGWGIWCDTWGREVLPFDYGCVATWVKEYPQLTPMVEDTMQDNYMSQNEYNHIKSARDEMVNKAEKDKIYEAIKMADYKK